MYIKAGIFIIVIGVLLHYIIKSFYQNEPNFCQTTGCNATKSLILDYRDPFALPCLDFYQYVCGNAKGDVFEALRAKPQQAKSRFKRKLLESSVDGLKAVDSVKAAVTFYQNCTAGRGRTNITSFEKLFGVNGTTSYHDLVGRKLNWLDLSIKAREAGLRHNFFLNVSTTFSYNDYRWYIKLRPVTAQYPNAWNQRNIGSIKMLLNYWQRNYNDIRVTDDDVKTLIDYGKMLSQFEIGQKRIILIRDFQIRTRSMPDLLLFLRNITKIDTLTADDRIDIDEQLFKSPKYWIFLEKITDSRTNFWFNYMALLTMLDECYFLEEPALAECTSILNTHPSTFCSDIIGSNMKGLLEAHYIKKKLNAQKRVKVLDIVDEIKTEFEREIKATHFSEKDARTLILNTLRNLLVNIAAMDVLYNPMEYEKYYGIDVTILNDTYISTSYNKLRKYVADRKFNALLAKTRKKMFLYFNDLTDIEVDSSYYHGGVHAIFIVPDLLQYPYFIEKRPQYLNVAMFVTVIAHEMIHSIVDLRPFEHLAPRWNSTNDVLYQRRVECITKQYEKYLKSIHVRLRDPKFHNKENIADVASVNVAYRVFLNAVKSEGQHKPLFPEKEFSINQLFWMLRGIHFCSTHKYEQREIEWDGTPRLQHGYSRYRMANGPMNSYGFAKDFGCSKKDPMNPKEKCRIFGKA